MTDIKEQEQVWSINFFDKKTGPRVSVFEKLVIKYFKRRKVYVRFKGNIWAADLAEMG